MSFTVHNFLPEMKIKVSILTPLCIGLMTAIKAAAMPILQAVAVAERSAAKVSFQHL